MFLGVAAPRRRTSRSERRSMRRSPSRKSRARSASGPSRASSATTAAGTRTRARGTRTACYRPPFCFFPPTPSVPNSLTLEPRNACVAHSLKISGRGLLMGLRPLRPAPIHMRKMTARSFGPSPSVPVRGWQILTSDRRIVGPTPAAPSLCRFTGPCRTSREPRAASPRFAISKMIFKILFDRLLKNLYHENEPSSHCVMDKQSDLLSCEQYAVLLEILSGTIEERAQLISR